MAGEHRAGADHGQAEQGHRARSGAVVPPAHDDAADPGPGEEERVGEGRHGARPVEIARHLLEAHHQQEHSAVGSHYQVRGDDEHYDAGGSPFCSRVGCARASHLGTRVSGPPCYQGAGIGHRHRLCYLGAGEPGWVRAARREGIPMASNGIPQIDIAPVLAGDPVGKRRIAERVRDALETIGFSWSWSHERRGIGRNGVGGQQVALSARNIWPKLSPPAAMYACSSVVVSRPSKAFRCGNRPNRATMSRWRVQPLMLLST